MGQAIKAELLFGTAEAAAFRKQVLAGCGALDSDELRELANELGDKADERLAQEQGLEEYTRTRFASLRSGLLTDKRL